VGKKVKKEKVGEDPNLHFTRDSRMLRAS